MAVVGVLVALLLPALGRAKNRARGVACVNNLKQWGTATLLYTVDNDDLLPHEGSAASLSRSKAWYVDLPVLINLPPYHEVSWRTNNGRTTENEIWVCPANKSTGTGKNSWHYSINADVNGDSKKTGSGFRVRITSIPRPVVSVWMFDTRHNRPVNAPYSTRNVLFSDLHGEGQNFVFLDGHVEQAKAGEYLDEASGRARPDNPNFIWRPLRPEMY